MPYVDVGGTRLHYLERGSGPLAVFIHGFPLDATMWVDQLDRLSDLRRCVAVDLRGFGSSDAGAGPMLGMERHADDVAGLIEALGEEQADIVALSMGGYVALAMAQLHGRRIRSLALVDTRAEADSAEGRAGRDDAARRLLHDGRPAFAAALVPRLVAPGTASIVRARLLTMIERTSYETIVAALAGMRDRPDRSGILERIGVPVSVIVGELDTLTPPAAAELMASRLTHGELHVVPGAGHMSPLEAPDRVAAILRTHLIQAAG